MVKCGRCHSRLSPLVRADARYCSTACRVAASRRRPPRGLRQHPAWVRHDEHKVPLQLDGRRARVDDPATWATWDQVNSSAVGVGTGVVLNGNGLVCIDLDKCVSGRRLAGWAEQLLSGLPGTYVEVSMSGRGLHIFGMADFPGGRVGEFEGHRVEIYGDLRYIAVTGRRWGQAPARLADVSGWLASRSLV